MFISIIYDYGSWLTVRTYKSIVRCITIGVIFPPPLMLLQYFQCHTMENRSYIKCRVFFFFFLLDRWAMGLSKSVSQPVSFNLILPCQRNLWPVVVCIFPKSLFQEISKMLFLFKPTHTVKSGSLQLLPVKELFLYLI